MIKKIKTYLPMFFSILFYWVYTFIIAVQFKDVTDNFNNSYLIFFMLGIIILFFVEWIYFIAHAARNKNLK